MEYKLPRVEDLRVDKLQYFEMLAQFDKVEDIGIIDTVNLNSAFTGLQKEVLLTVTKESNYKLSGEIMKLVTKYKKQDLKPSYTFDGVKYNLTLDLGTMPTAFWVDTSVQDMSKNPIRMASSIYVEDGMKYSELDENKNIKNPVAKRDEVFRKHLPLFDYLDIQGFFLHKYNILTPLYIKAKAEVSHI